VFFELFIAFRYLIPRKRFLSTSLVFLLSVGVISLVVWLVLVFLSVTAGIERNWLQKLTSLHAPLRLTPTERYYHSYYYQIDAFSASSGYTFKTIGEKAEVAQSDPYRPEQDVELSFVASPDRLQDGTLRDPVQQLYAVLNELGYPFQDYELAGGLLRLNIAQHAQHGTTLSQMSYLLSFPDRNPHLASLLLPPLPEERDVPSVSVVDTRCQLPCLSYAEPIVLPKSYRDLGVRMGDQGSLQFASTFSQEQRVTVQVVGFYDPGLFSLGGRCIIVPQSLTRTIHAANQTFSPDGTPTNGIFVWCNLNDVDAVQQRLERHLVTWGLYPYWKVTAYRDFEFSKDLFQQFRSDRTLFLFIAVLILFVACCNVISLLILLVQDKKREIAILAAMGASKKSLALIFGFSGLMLGTISTILGTSAALMTLRHLDVVVKFLSFLQGHTAFQPAFFGKTLPNQLSGEALLFIFTATPLLSLLAGLIPALRAMRIQPAVALRDNG
jgi:lipoprotein-releasing system permease protein